MISPKNYKQLRDPSSFEGVEAYLQGQLNNLVYGLDLAIALRMVMSGEVLVNARLSN